MNDDNEPVAKRQRFADPTPPTEHTGHWLPPEVWTIIVVEYLWRPPHSLWTLAASGVTSLAWMSHQHMASVVARAELARLRERMVQYLVHVGNPSWYIGGALFLRKHVEACLDALRYRYRDQDPIPLPPASSQEQPAQQPQPPSRSCATLDADYALFKLYGWIAAQHGLACIGYLGVGVDRRSLWDQKCVAMPHANDRGWSQWMGHGTINSFGHHRHVSVMLWTESPTGSVPCMPNLHAAAMLSHFEPWPVGSRLVYTQYADRETRLGTWHHRRWIVLPVPELEEEVLGAQEVQRPFLVYRQRTGSPCFAAAIAMHKVTIFKSAHSEYDTKNAGCRGEVVAFVNGFATFCHALHMGCVVCVYYGEMDFDDDDGLPWPGCDDNVDTTTPLPPPIEGKSWLAAISPRADWVVHPVWARASAWHHPIDIAAAAQRAAAAWASMAPALCAPEASRCRLYVAARSFVDRI